MEYTIGPVRYMVDPRTRSYVVEEPALSPEAAEAVKAIEEWLSLRGLEPESDNIATAADHLGYAEVYQREATAIEYHVRRLMSGWGPLYPMVLDEGLEEVSVPRPGPVYVVHREVPGVYLESSVVLEREALEDVIRELSVRAGTSINPAYPIAEFDYGRARVAAALGLVASTGPSLTVRLFPSQPYSLDRLVELRLLPREAAEYLRCLLLGGGMVFVIGPPGAGKTTLMAALLDSLPDPDWKVVVVEETPEVRLRRRNWSSFHTREPRSLAEPERITVTMEHLLKHALRLRPHVVAVAEARFREVVYLFHAASLGVASAATFHARNIEELTTRLTLLGVPKELLDNLHAVALLGIVELPEGGRARRMLGLWERWEGEFRLLWEWSSDTDTWEERGEPRRCVSPSGQESGEAG
ncbi:hypothetical protein Pyrde_0731 [Pyrodictium delaneyi]|uniref:Bacterial type II secretion system protein E domain-containing protein n=1 Tax=Pyrodictium delaneyi TaxID=1273541 RepID=A0A0P0N2Q8_9CREN|nr:type II/IV secretion system ATPase subunit [Pyrodictium delaneyi]ALL00781.1 hypothetical protein Pyrde_0731 [Pyrodictium delaneyi]